MTNPFPLLHLRKEHQAKSVVMVRGHSLLSWIVAKYWCYGSTYIFQGCSLCATLHKLLQDFKAFKLYMLLRLYPV